MFLINLKRAGLISVSVLLLGVVFFGMTKSLSNIQSAATPDKKPADEINRLKTENSDAFREMMNNGNLSELLANQEINYSQTNLLPDRVAGSRTIRVNFEPVEKNLTGNEFSTQKSGASFLKQMASARTSDRPLSRQRAFELSPSQILIVSVDWNKQVLWWDLQTDPRVFRAETADDKGVLSGQTLYRANAEMIVSFPAAEEITELYFYSPQWDGKAYSLELIGKLNLNNPAEPE